MKFVSNIQINKKIRRKLQSVSVNFRQTFIEEKRILPVNASL